LTGVAIADAIRMPVRIRMNAHHGSTYIERHDGRRRIWFNQLAPDVWPVVVGRRDVTGRIVTKAPEM
jgi:hypothetical protein